MLTFKIRPASDTEDVFLPMLEKLTKSRLEAKARMKTAADVERAYWDGIQGSYKILINSFYGYLGYAHANFNDYNAARLVTEKGQEIILKAVHLLEDLQAKILEVVTDGAYFVVPPGGRRGRRDAVGGTCLIRPPGRNQPVLTMAVFSE